MMVSTKSTKILVLLFVQDSATKFLTMSQKLGDTGSHNRYSRVTGNQLNFFIRPTIIINDLI